MNTDQKKITKWFLIRMREAGRNYVCKQPEDMEIKPGEYCVVELDRAEDYGKILSFIEPSPDDIKGSIVKRIKRKLTENDLIKIDENKKKANQAYQKCLRRISEHNLDMKLVDVEFSLDCSKVIFYFTADGRVDFRELVKSLATEFRARIELRQIGVRDESKILGGLASCGRQLCCCTFLYEFAPINIRMAKEQRLPLNPSKISGLCGRLHCCLRYEYKYYRKTAKTMPREGSIVSTRTGQGKVIDLNIIKRTVLVQLENQNITEFPVEEIKILKDQPLAKVETKRLGEEIDVKELRKLEDIPSDLDEFDDDDDDELDSDTIQTDTREKDKREKREFKDRENNQNRPNHHNHNNDNRRNFNNNNNHNHKK